MTDSWSMAKCISATEGAGTSSWLKRPEAVRINRLVVASGSRGCTNTLLPRHSILYDELPAATSMTGSASSMMLKWLGAVSTRITLCRSDFSVSILWALAASAMAMVKAMVFCMPKFPPIPALLQKPSGQGAVPGPGFTSSARGQILRYQTAYLPLEAGEAFGHQWLAAVAELGGLTVDSSAAPCACCP